MKKKSNNIFYNYTNKMSLKISKIKSVDITDNYLNLYVDNSHLTEYQQKIFSTKTSFPCTVKDYDRIIMFFKSMETEKCGVLNITYCEYNFQITYVINTSTMQITSYLNNRVNKSERIYIPSKDDIDKIIDKITFIYRDHIKEVVSLPIPSVPDDSPDDSKFDYEPIDKTIILLFNNDGVSLQIMVNIKEHKDTFINFLRSMSNNTDCYIRICNMTIVYSNKENVLEISRHSEKYKFVHTLTIEKKYYDGLLNFLTLD
jgi:hypothetical protein